MVVGLGGQGMWAPPTGPWSKLGAKLHQRGTVSVAFDPGLGRAFLLALG